MVCGEWFLGVRRSISRSPLWSSWFISLLIQYTLNEEYKYKSSVELLGYLLTDFIDFYLVRNISRSPLWSSWAISLLIPYTFNKKYKQKSSVELLVHFLTDSIHFNKESKQKSCVQLLLYFPIICRARNRPELQNLWRICKICNIGTVSHF